MDVSVFVVSDHPSVRQYPVIAVQRCVITVFFKELMQMCSNFVQVYGEGFLLTRLKQYLARFPNPWFITNLSAGGTCYR